MLNIGDGLVTFRANRCRSQVPASRWRCLSRTDNGGRDGTRDSSGRGHPRIANTRLDQHHATITRNTGDDFRVSSRRDTHSASAGDGSPTDDAPEGVRLRHGSGFTIRDTKFVFQRDEFADRSHAEDED